jgi:hypothetical protein
MLGGSSDAVTTNSGPQHRSQRHLSSPKIACRSLIIAPLAYHTTASAVAVEMLSARHRHLDNDFTGQWNGQWHADSSSYNADCTGSSCNDDGSGWLDTADPEALTPEQIITYVSLGILGFMTLLCLVCYPEIISVPSRALLKWCCNDSSLANGADAGGDFVGGRDKVTGAETTRSRRKKAKQGFGTSMNVELV